MTPVAPLFLMLFFNHALGQTFCTSTMDLSTFLMKSFRANADLIRLGVPSEFVKRYFDKAVMDVTLSCNCSSSTIDDNCVSLFFAETMEVSYIRDLLEIDSVMTEQTDNVASRKLFPLYQANVTLHGLSVAQTDELNKALNHLLLNSQSIVNIQSRYWQRSRFPSDEQFFQDTFAAQKDACDLYQSHVNLDNRTFPAWGATTYVIGLFLEVHKAKGNETAAMEMIADHTRFAFNGARCFRVSGSQLRYPVIKMEQYMRIARTLLDETNTLFKPELKDIRKVSAVPMLYHSRLVNILSSLSSNGDGETILTTDGSTIRREHVINILTDNLEVANVVDSNPIQYECPDGYILASRAVPLVSLDEQCCSKKCEFAELSVLDQFAFAISQENCCASCNYFECTDHSLLPATLPLLDNGNPTLITI